MKRKFGVVRIELTKLDELNIDFIAGKKYTTLLLNVFEEPTSAGNDFVISQDCRDENITLGWGKFKEINNKTKN